MPSRPAVHRVGRPFIGISGYDYKRWRDVFYPPGLPSRPYAEEITADFVYVRLHGSTELYVSGYTDQELAVWARKVVAWLRGRPSSDVYVYFDNDAAVRAPFDALGLRARVESLLTER